MFRKFPLANGTTLAFASQSLLKRARTAKKRMPHIDVFWYWGVNKRIYFPRHAFGSDDEVIEYTIDCFSHEHMHHLLHEMEEHFASIKLDSLYGGVWRTSTRDESGLWLKHLIEYKLEHATYGALLTPF